MAEPMNDDCRATENADRAKAGDIIKPWKKGVVASHGPRTRFLCFRGRWQRPGVFRAAGSRLRRFLAIFGEDCRLLVISRIVDKKLRPSKELALDHF